MLVSVISAKADFISKISQRGTVVRNSLDSDQIQKPFQNLIDSVKGNCNMTDPDCLEKSCEVTAEKKRSCCFVSLQFMNTLEAF